MSMKYKAEVSHSQTCYVNVLYFEH